MRSTPILVSLVLLLAGAGPAAAAEPAEISVFKTPTCGCCTKWVEHLRAEGFSVRATDVPDLAPIKRDLGVPAELAACHTAQLEGYVVEGHVPAADLKRLLEERPAVTGLAVPGMPIGSPGMEGPDSSRDERYRTLSFGPGGVDVFAEHGPGAE